MHFGREMNCCVIDLVRLSTLNSEDYGQQGAVKVNVRVVGDGVGIILVAVIPGNVSSSH